MSIKNNIATSVTYIQRKHEIIIKTIHHIINILSTEVELFTMRYSISWITQLQDIINIIIITDTIHVANFRVTKSRNTEIVFQALKKI